MHDNLKISPSLYHLLKQRCVTKHKNFYMLFYPLLISCKVHNKHNSINKYKLPINEYFISYKWQPLKHNILLLKGQGSCLVKTNKCTFHYYLHHQESALHFQHSVHSVKKKKKLNICKSFTMHNYKYMAVLKVLFPHPQPRFLLQFQMFCFVLRP